MRSLLIILTVVALSSCSRVCTICEIDVEANKRISDKFNSYDKTLWPRLETEFFNRLYALDSAFVNTDKRLAIVGLSAFVAERGYPSEYYVDFNDENTKKLISDLKSIGLTEEKYQEHSFLYPLISPALSDCDNLEQLLTIPRDMVVVYGATNPDSLSLSYEMDLYSLHRHYGTMSLKRPGLYKTLIILFFTRMMNEKEFKQLHTTKPKAN